MNWTYEGKEIIDISQFPENTFGFIYEVTHVPSGKKYIGKKQLFFNKKLPPLKGQKRWRKVVKEGNWKNYFGSHDYIKGLLKENKQEEFTREIIQICYTKKELTYSETKYQMMFEVLENPSYINANILGKFFRSDLENYKD